MGRLSRSLRILLEVEDSPHHIALSFGIGVWIAFFPIWGIHTAMALGLAFALRLPRAAMILGAYVNNPWTLAPLYTAGTIFGCWILGVPVEGLAGLDWSLQGGAFVASLLHTLRPYLWPYVIGNTIVGIVGGVAAYVLLRIALERRRSPPEALPSE
jgi:uncharacterized protein (DUF2062 family)